MINYDSDWDYYDDMEDVERETPDYMYEVELMYENY